MKKLGMVGGLGPESTVEYYNTIISLFRTQTGQDCYPEFSIYSLDVRKVANWLEAGDRPAVARYLIDAIEKLARAGAEFAAISANTPHIVFDEVRMASPIPLISIVETTAKAVKASGWKRPALWGTRFTMQSDFYPKVFSREGLNLEVPSPDDQEYLHDKYMNELVRGIFQDQTRRGLLRIVDRMQEEKQIDAVMLAGTELSLILREPTHNGIPFLDTLRVHAEAIVAEMLT
jgi:aspartate racemase